MTKKDYEALAKALSALAQGSDNIYRSAGIEASVKVVAEVLQNDNSRFDRNRFLAACGFGHDGQA